MTQQGDVRLFHTDDGGEIAVNGGVLDMDGGLETAVYLSIFGGNSADPGGDDRSLSWWGNLAERDQALHLRSETQHLLRSVPATPGNLGRVRDAVLRDLAWMKEKGVVSTLDVAVRVEGLNKVRITVTIEAQGAGSTFVYLENWKATE